VLPRRSTSKELGTTGAKPAPDTTLRLICDRGLLQRCNFESSQHQESFMPSLLRRVIRTSSLLATVLVWTTITPAAITVTTDPADFEHKTWPQPETGNVVAVDGQPKIEIAPDSGVDGLLSHFVESVDLSGGKVVSQVFKPTANFKLGAISLYADGLGTFDANSQAHIPLTVHLYQLVDGTAGVGSMPASYNLSTAGTGDVAAEDLFGETGLPFTYNGVQAFTYEFVELNFDVASQVQLNADSVYALEIRGNALTGAFNPQRLSAGSPGGTNPYAGGDSYVATNGTLTTARTRPQSGSFDLMMAFYEAISTPPSGHPGDFDLDGDVDGADFVAWQTNFPKATGATLSQGDADADGDVDGADFVVWQTNFPFTPGPGAAPVPEPAAILLAVLAIPAMAKLTRRSRKS
jgi:hypothetical protein